MHSRSKSLLAFLLVLTLTPLDAAPNGSTSRCRICRCLLRWHRTSPLWSAMASGQQANRGDVAVIQNISAQFSRDLNRLQLLYADYKANPQRHHAS